MDADIVFQQEKERLCGTLDLVEKQRQISREELGQAQARLDDAYRYERDNTALLESRMILLDKARQTLRAMENALLKPYFTRVDFTPTGGENESIYIGKHSVMPLDGYEPVVHDWRAPIANLYYSGQIGPMNYQTPDGDVRGELTLKRQFTIENGQLEGIFDTDIVSKDSYLQSVLGVTSGDRLRDIVTTIQAEQNYVIRYPLDKTLIVQGVAGSGKTTIALHRIAYLLYAFQNQLRPEHVLIIAPNPLFLNFIAGVLPDLGVEMVRQTTFIGLVSDWLGPLLPPVRHHAAPVYDLPGEERSEMVRLMRFKGSSEMVSRLERWLDALERALPPDRGIRFGPVTLYTSETLRKLFLEDEKPFPLTRRIAQFKKDLTQRVRAAADKVTQWLRDETDRRCDKLRAAMPQGEARRLKLVSLYDSRDQRIKEVEERVQPFIKDVMAALPSYAPSELYQRFIGDLLETSEPGSDAYLAARYTQNQLRGGRIEPEDVAPIALIAMRTHELRRTDIRHVVVDEAQDMSLTEFTLLTRMTRGASMTVVGDLMQGIRSWRGLTSWQPLEDLFDGKAAKHTLVTSYRSTIEIMDMALRESSHFPVAEQKEARPVLRHGEAPRILSYRSADEQARLIVETVLAWQARGYKAIAIIDRSEKSLAALKKKLDPSIDTAMLDVQTDHYEAGVALARAGDVKGFEFDGVIVADASEARYGMDELDARLLFVCLTRPLHSLVCLYHGALSPLLT